MTDMETALARANSAGFRVMEDARYGKPDECVDWEGVFDRVCETIIATLAAEMAAAGLKVVGRENLKYTQAVWDDWADTLMSDSEPLYPDTAWDWLVQEATCELQAALRPERETGGEG